MRDQTYEPTCSTHRFVRICGDGDDSKRRWGSTLVHEALALGVLMMTSEVEHGKYVGSVMVNIIGDSGCRPDSFARVVYHIERPTARKH